MRHRYAHLDPRLLQALMEEMSLQNLFNQLVLAAGGDPEQAMEWMRYLQQEGYISESIDLEAFFDSLEEQQMIQRDGDGNVGDGGGGVAY